MATRQAILIGAAKVKPELPGVIVDIKDIKNFLLSNLGGAWKETEIVTLVDQPSAAVNRVLETAKYKDYVFIGDSAEESTLPTTEDCREIK